MSRSTRSIGLTLVTVAGIASLAIAPAAAPAASNHRQRGKHKGSHHTAKPTTRRTKDRNRNGIPDTWEKAFGLSVRTNQAKKDADQDGLSNKAEFLANTDPTNPDTDADGTPDGQEHAGKVISFDGTTLVVGAFGGAQLTGTVDASTEVQCEQGESVVTPPTTTVRSHGGDDQGDDADTEDQGDDDGTPAAGPTPASSGSSHSGGGSAADQGDDDGQEQGDDNGSDGENETGGDATCPAGVLAPDAIVHEGHLSVTASGAHWDEITIVI